MEKAKPLIFRISAFAFIAILLFPLLMMLVRALSHASELVLPFDDEFFKVFALSFTQSLVSSFISVVFGLLGAFGLLGFRAGWPRKVSEFVMLTPSLFPALFVIMATLNIVTLFGPFPFGIWGVIIAHSLTNFGLVAVVVASVIESKLGAVIEISTIEGAGKFQIIWQCLKAMLGEITSLFFFIFVLCFTSFSVPLVLGANSGATLEILIYRAIVKHGSIGQAVSLALVEMMLVFAFSVVLKISFSADRREPRSLRRVFLPQGLYVALFLSVLVIGNSFRGIFDGITALRESSNFAERIPLLLAGSFAESAAVALITFLLLTKVYLLNSQRVLDRFLSGYVAPSLVVTGFAIYLLLPVETLAIPLRLICISVGFAFLMLPSIYRLRGRSVMSSLQGQIDVARVEGASTWLIFFKIIWPQRRHEILWLCGLAGFWASGDFAFATLIAGRDITMAMTAQTLLGGYRFELATAMTWMSLIVGGLVFLVCQLLGGVRRANY